MRKRIVAGNWKMNLSWEEANDLFSGLMTDPKKSNQVMIFPPAIYLQDFVRRNTANIAIGAQNAYPGETGAYTGEISITQLSSIGVKHLLVGHSERRAYFGEHHDFLKQKVDKCIEHHIQPVFCCGEPLSIRENGEEQAFVLKQLNESLFHLDPEDFKKCIIAYEPVWAIGTGKTATSQQAEDMHAAIRSWIKEIYGQEIADETTLLYGGSCNPSNAKELFECPNVDGGLIGGASLKVEMFNQIIDEI